MIRDAKRKAEVVECWAAVKKLGNGGHQSLIPGAGFVDTTPDDAYYNLPFVLAYAVLDDVLAALIEQGTFTCQGNAPMLERKMHAAKTQGVSWVDYTLVSEGRIKRKALAHRAKVLPKADCLKYVAAVEAELKAWSIV